jgi:putative oxygen-independent coproporphyrinogen III oxidase
MTNNSLPISLYIHFPWCLQKCPYCDFNSFGFKPTAEDEKQYIAALITDLKNDWQKFLLKDKKIISIFLGGGTPTLFSVNSIAKLFNEITKIFCIDKKTEITIEANPGTISKIKCKELFNVGINRISIGVQSFQDDKLKLLGRIHNANDAIDAVNAVIAAGFENFNLDLMFGLPMQKNADAIYDLNFAIKLKPTHISWYQLTIEENTKFFQCKNSLNLPDEENIWEMQQKGKEILNNANYLQYETSAFAKALDYQCKHNLNYWEFGDYVGIGAGAHGKIGLTRLCKKIDVQNYLNALNNNTFIAEESFITRDNLPFEFMLNALRLFRPIEISLFEKRTGLDFAIINPILQKAVSLGLLKVEQNYFITTDKGKNFLNNLLELFLPQNTTH